ncbi:MAG: cob(I)yrinic acid a,c-diamide adenosyltransferase [Bdellovibrionales bacterium]|nr:cob(I)yrinic acid a,c-diamide adenosyltransferase [Bdellovibrionales bacterium]
MKIYTKTGDKGETGLQGGSRVKKSHPRVSAYGTLDEANSMIGLGLSFLKTSAPVARLSRIQEELFQLGAELATAPGGKNSAAMMGAPEITRLEQEIDIMEKDLEPLKSFILPSGGSAGSAFHLARTIVRRAERACVELSGSETLRPELIQYLNRLSDYLFVVARYVNHLEGKPETKWIPKKV